MSVYISWVYSRFLTPTRPYHKLHHVEADAPLSSNTSLLYSPLSSSRRRDRRAPPPDLSLFLAKVLGKLCLDLRAGELRHGLRTLDRADAVGPGAGEDDVHLL